MPRLYSFHSESTGTTQGSSLAKILRDLKRSSVVCVIHYTQDILLIFYRELPELSTPYSVEIGQLRC